jgi:hypothetical protein
MGFSRFAAGLTTISRPGGSTRTAPLCTGAQLVDIICADPQTYDGDMMCLHSRRRCNHASMTIPGCRRSADESSVLHRIDEQTEVSCAADQPDGH